MSSPFLSAGYRRWRSLLRSPAWVVAILIWAVLCLTRLAFPEGSPWLRLGLAATVIWIGRDLLFAGLEPFLRFFKLTRDTLPALAATGAFLLSFLIAVLYTAGRLPAEFVGAGGTPRLLVEGAVAIVAISLAARSMLRAGGGPRAAVARPTDAARGHEAYDNARLALPAVLGLSCLVAALWRWAGSDWVAAFNAALAAMVVLDPFLREMLRRILSEKFHERLGQASMESSNLGVDFSLALPDTILFQKSEVLTEGRPRVTEFCSLSEEHGDKRVLTLAVAAESGVRHRIRRAMIERSRPTLGTLPHVKGFEHMPARGVKALLRGQELLCGNVRLFEEEGWPEATLERLRERALPLQKRGDTVVFVGLAGKLVGLLALRDPARDEARQTVAALRARRIDVGLLTGENETSATALGKEIGGIRAYAGLTPRERAAAVTGLVAEGRKVAVVATRKENREALAAATLAVEWPTTDGAASQGNSPHLAEASVRLASPKLVEVREFFEFLGHARRRFHKLLASVFLYQLAALCIVTGLLEPLCGLPPSPTLAAIFFFAARRIVIMGRQCRRTTTSSA